jgi:hypothetical protein
VLNPANPAQAASTGDNFRDNVEQLYATNLPTGRYRLRLTHKGNLQANLPQKFSLILSGAPLYTPTLPVSWLSLSAKQIDWNLCEINFACAQEINNKEFKIECSGNGIDFFEVGSIPSKQSTSYVTTKYQFLHELFSKTINGTWFYRIKQIDVNNNFSYSNTISVTIYNGWMVAYVFPNPFTQDCFLTIYNDRNAKLLIELFSLTGQLKEEMRIDILAGNGVNKITLPTNNLLSGMYFLRVSEPNTSQYYFNKIIKQ